MNRKVFKYYKYFMPITIKDKEINLNRGVCLDKLKLSKIDYLYILNL